MLVALAFLLFGLQVGDAILSIHPNLYREISLKVKLKKDMSNTEAGAANTNTEIIHLKVRSQVSPGL